MQPFELNDLPRYSRWPSEILKEGCEKRVKNPEQISREFGLEKWGCLLKKWQEHPCGIEAVRAWEISPEALLPALDHGSLMLMAASAAHERYADLIEGALLEDPSAHLVEIGCGYGSILLELMGRARLHYQSVFGLEYTSEGMELARNLAAWHGHNLTIGHGDFNSENITDVEIPRDCDILTSYSFHYVRDTRSALLNILNLKPRRVLHFEPILQHYENDAILGLLQRRYLEINDYNSSLRSELTRLADEGIIEIIREEAMAFGANCLLPASTIIWCPAKHT